MRGDALAPLAKWDAVAPYLAAARLVGSIRAFDLTTERLSSTRLSPTRAEEHRPGAAGAAPPGLLPRRAARDVANVERCQVNSLDADPFCETESPTCSTRNISIAGLVRGRAAQVEQESGVEVGTLDDYLDVIEWVFDTYAARAVAVKCFWAYFRRLAVGHVDAPPRRAFGRLRRDAADARERRAVEDFLFRRCVDLATRAGLPVKLHLGSLGRNGDPHLRHVFRCVADVTPLVQECPRTTFVLMHMAWPQQEQLLALAKHQPNVVVDLSWLWTAAPRSACDFVQRFLTTVPATKLLCFGADYLTVENVVGHAELARRGLQRALEGLVTEGWLTEDDASRVAPLLMRGNAERILPAPHRRRPAPQGRGSVGEVTR